MIFNESTRYIMNHISLRAEVFNDGVVKVLEEGYVMLINFIFYFISLNMHYHESSLSQIDKIMLNIMYVSQKRTHLVSTSWIFLHSQPDTPFILNTTHNWLISAGVPDRKDPCYRATFVSNLIVL